MQTHMHTCTWRAVAAQICFFCTLEARGQLFARTKPADLDGLISSWRHFEHVEWPADEAAQAGTPGRHGRRSMALVSAARRSLFAARLFPH